MPYPPVTQFETRALGLTRLRVAVHAAEGIAHRLAAAGFDVRADRPDVVVTDDPAIARTTRQTRPFAGVVLITPDPSHASRVLVNGPEGVGYITDASRLVDTVTRVAAGQSVLDPAVVQALVQARTRPSAPTSQRPSSCGSASHPRASSRPRSINAVANSGAKNR
jgi:DNA-binding NarL/FixJ family response regulator